MVLLSLDAICLIVDNFASYIRMRYLKCIISSGSNAHLLYHSSYRVFWRLPLRFKLSSKTGIKRVNLNKRRGKWDHDAIYDSYIKY